jgi:RNA polymerase sigma factor (sigma-70 family)
MTEARLAPVLRHLRRLAAAPGAGEPADAVLLGRLATSRDREAFAELLRRHGPLVWRVCRRLLPQADQAEDAFQATWLLLCQRAGSIRKPAALASWLHGVAYRVASRARCGRAREVPGGRGTGDRPAAADPCQEAASRELGRILEEEVASLPERLRLPLLLCYWRGLTNEEAARELGWPAGTVKTRLARARGLLHTRLTARGVTLPAAAAALLTSGNGAEAAVPPGLVAATAQAVTAPAGAEAGAARSLSAKADELATAALPAAGLGKGKLAVALALALGAVALGAGGLSHPREEGPPVAAKQGVGGAGRQPQRRPAKKATAPERAEPPDPLQAYRDRLIIEEQKFTQIVEATVRKARCAHPDDPEGSLRLLRRTLLQVWDNPDIRERVRQTLLTRLLAERWELAGK